MQVVFAGMSRIAKFCCMIDIRTLLVTPVNRRFHVTKYLEQLGVSEFCEQVCSVLVITGSYVIPGTMIKVLTYWPLNMSAAILPTTHEPQHF